VARVGYARVSSERQVTDGQLARLESAHVDRTFVDEAESGRKASRPEFDRMLDFLRQGDQLVVVRLDRLGRSVKNLIALVEQLKDKGVDLVVLDQGIDTGTPAGRFFFHVMAALAEMEADLIRERTMDGLAAARAKGNLGGRPKSYSPATAQAVLALRTAGQTLTEISTVCNVSRRTVSRILADAQAA
jgi:DNA invertase Pin-like site-specific DNA recombinase